MQTKGRRLISELKAHVLENMKGIEQCQLGRQGVVYREIQDLAGLNLDLPAQDGWLTWSILASLREDGLVDAEKRGRRLYWRLAAKSE